MAKLIGTLASAVSLFASPAFAQEDIIARIERACEADIRRFCTGVERGEGAVLNCLAENYGQLSNACQQALDGDDDETLYDDATRDGVEERESR